MRYKKYEYKEGFDYGIYRQIFFLSENMRGKYVIVKLVTLNRTLLLQKKDITTASIININRARITLGKGRRRIQ